MNEIYQRALSYPAGEWFDVCEINAGEPHVTCWMTLCTASLARFVRPADHALLIANEDRSKFYWIPKAERHYTYLWLRKREK